MTEAKEQPKGKRGRPRVAPEDRNWREGHQIKAYPHEYEIIKRFILLVRKYPERCEKVLEILESWEEGGKEEW